MPIFSTFAYEGQVAVARKRGGAKLAESVSGLQAFVLQLLHFCAPEEREWSMPKSKTFSWLVVQCASFLVPGA